MSDFNRHTFPNGGWQFFQPQTGWHAPTPGSSTFDQTVVLIIKHRQANPAVVAKHGLPVDPGNVANELEAYTKKRLGIADPPPPPQQWLHRLNQVVAGAKTLADWLGGDPVAQDKASHRAEICSVCPQNTQSEAFKKANPDHQPNWLDRFTVNAQNLIRRQLEERKQLNLSTSLDEKVGMCEACSCPLHLKIHVPIENINKRIPAKDRQALDPQCWILAETVVS